MPRVRRPLTPPDQRDIAEREPCRPLEPAERDALDQGEDVALERGEVDELVGIGIGSFLSWSGAVQE